MNVTRARRRAVSDSAPLSLSGCAESARDDDAAAAAHRHGVSVAPSKSLRPTRSLSPSLPGVSLSLPLAP